MSSNSICFCIPFRIGTILFLIYFLVINLWLLFDRFKTLEDKSLNDYSKKYYYIIIVELLLGFAGGLIFLTAILSVTINKFRPSVLKTVYVFLLLSEVYSFIAAFHYNSQDVNEKYVKVLNEEIKEGKFMTVMRKCYFSFRSIVFILFVQTAIISYSISVFHRFMKQSKENSVNGKTYTPNI